MSEKIAVFSNSRSTVCISIPYLHLKKEWNKKGAKVMIDKEVLEEAMFDPGVEYMFKNGILYIKEMATKIDLGLEPEGAQKPENIIILTDAEKDDYMKNKQAWQLKEVLNKLTYEGKKDFCEYVVEHELLDGPKAAVIKETCGFDVLHAIQNKQANAEKTED